MDHYSQAPESATSDPGRCAHHGFSRGNGTGSQPCPSGSIRDHY